MSGKDICRYLKEIRRKIAKENDIPLEIPECHFQGECLGTCPKCDAEINYLEQQLAVRKKLSKTAAVIGIAAGLTFAGQQQAIAQTDSARYLTAGLIEEIIIGYITPTKSDEPLRTSDVAKPFRGRLSMLDYGDFDDADVQSSPPRFVGGEKAMYEFIESHMQYPDEARKNKIEGAVKLKIHLSKSGEVKRVKVIQKAHPLLDAEAVRILSLMPPWEPARFNDNPIATTREIEVIFKLKE